MALYIKGTPNNLSKVRAVLDIFCRASRAKIKWGKLAAIWTSKGKREWEWGQEIGLKWILKGTEANFDKLMLSLKGKLITRGHPNLSLVGKILVANQVLLASMWYLVACWNPNPRMCNQIKGVVCNFIWGGKATNTLPKVKWDFLTLPLSNIDLGIIDPKAQSEALFAKLLMRGLIVTIYCTPSPLRYALTNKDPVGSGTTM
jgi:hypothetical protein